MNTTIAASIDIAAQKAQLDAACKQLLAEKMILAWIMKSTMKEYHSLSVREIADNCIIGTPDVAHTPVLPDETNASKISGTGLEDTTITEGTITYDIQFRAILPTTGEQAGMIINIEAQNDFYPGYPLLKRAIYYCSRMISAQYGTEFTNSHYEKIKKVYSVWICMNPPKGMENTITSYSLAENNIVGAVRAKAEQFDLMTAVMICLGDLKQAQENSLLRLLDVLLSNDTAPGTKKQILSDDFDIPMTQQLEGRIHGMCNISDGIWTKGLEQGIEKGIEKGIEQGLAQGKAMGAEESILDALKSLMETLRLTVEQAMDALRIPSEEREKYRRKLEET